MTSSVDYNSHPPTRRVLESIREGTWGAEILRIQEYNLTEADGGSIVVAKTIDYIIHPPKRRVLESIGKEWEMKRY